MDSISETRLQDLHPKLAAAIRQMAEVLALDNPPVHLRVTQGLRSWNEQAKLWAQGRTTLGKIVTNAQPGHSWHQFALAADVVPLSLDEKTADWDISHPQWKRLVEVGVSLGLQAGAEFRTFPDYPHFQMTGSLPISPDDEVRQLWKDGGTDAVWAATGL